MRPSQLPNSVPARNLSLCHGKYWVVPSIRGQRDPWYRLEWANSRTCPANLGIPPDLEWPEAEPSASAVTSVLMATRSVIPAKKPLWFPSLGLKRRPSEGFPPHSAWPLQPTRSTFQLLLVSYPIVLLWTPATLVCCFSAVYVSPPYFRAFVLAVPSSEMALPQIPMP